MPICVKIRQYCLFKEYIGGAILFFFHRVKSGFCLGQFTAVVTAAKMQQLFACVQELFLKIWQFYVFFSRALRRHQMRYSKNVDESRTSMCPDAACGAWSDLDENPGTSSRKDTSSKWGGWISIKDGRLPVRQRGLLPFIFWLAPMSSVIVPSGFELGPNLHGHLRIGLDL